MEGKVASLSRSEPESRALPGAWDELPDRIEFINLLRLLVFGHEDAAMSCPPLRMVLCSCSIILILACGCKQAPWEHLTPQYSDSDPPHLDSSRSPFQATGKLFSIAVSSDGQRLWAVGGGSTILKSDDRGDHWASVGSETSNYLYLLAVTSDGQRVWAVGNGGRILKSDDRGDHWTAVASGTTWSLRSIATSSDGRRLLAVGDISTILKSDDRGDHWTPVISGTTSIILNSIAVSSDGQRMWTVGYAGQILKSDDRGDHWMPVASGSLQVIREFLGQAIPGEWFRGRCLV